MKFRIIFLFVFLLTCPFQANVFSQISIGAYTGITSPKLTGDSSPYAFYDLKIGGVFGLRIDIPLSRSVDLSVLPAFTQYRGKYMVYDWNDKPLDSLNVRYNVFSIPLGITITSMNERFYVFGGFEFRVPLSMKGYGVGNTIDLSNILRKYNIAVQFSAGYKIPIGKPLLYFELGYSQGLTKIGKETSDIDSYLLRVRHRDIKFFVGIQVPLGKKD